MAADVGILIIDDDVDSQRALRQVLDSEGWRVQIVPLASQALAELSKGEWTLILVNVALTDLSGTLFNTLRDLGQAEANAGDLSRKRVRVLFMVPELAARAAQPVLEREQLPYTLKPFHLHDFLEKISDLLLEAQAIPGPIRQMQGLALSAGRRLKARNPGKDSRQPKMFASREDYQMTEEEIAEFEKQEEVDRKKRQKKTPEHEPIF
ncbi:MAG TPA: response regulator [Candidatus Acidoferrales bacterium]|nr:response regulator [Candidatus Acidoferrales bacterium]